MTDHNQADHEAQKVEDADGGVAGQRTAGKEVGSFEMDLALEVKNQLQQHSWEGHLEEMYSSLDLEEDESWAWTMVEKLD